MTYISCCESYSFCFGKFSPPPYAQQNAFKRCYGLLLCSHRSVWYASQTLFAKVISSNYTGHFIKFLLTFFLFKHTALNWQYFNSFIDRKSFAVASFALYILTWVWWSSKSSIALLWFVTRSLIIGPAWLTFTDVETVFIHHFTCRSFELFLAANTICRFLNHANGWNGIHFAKVLMRWNLLSIKTAKRTLSRTTSVHLYSSHATLAGRFRRAFKALGRAKLKSSSYVRKEIFRDGRVKRGFGSIINRIQKNEDTSQSKVRKVRTISLWSADLHTGLQSDVTLRTYIFQRLFTNFQFTIVST